MEFTIYGKENCTYCEQAKALLTTRGLDFEYLQLGTDYTREELIEMAPDAKSVPQIWASEGNTTVKVGGFKELQEYFKNVDAAADEISELFGNAIFEDGLVELLQEGLIVNVSFTKKDGTERKMLCTTNPSIISERYTYDKKTDRVKAQSEDVVSVFDLENNGWRSFRLDSVISYDVSEEV